LLFHPSTAGANGRFPRAQRLIEDPRDPAHLVLAATYGLVTTRDRGQNWYHVCEASFSGLEMYVGDPLLEFAADGTMLVGVQAGLNRSADEGCSWLTAIGGSGNEEVVDYTVSKTAPGRVVGLRSETEDGSIVIRLYESTDHGRVFLPIGKPLPILTAFTVDVAPSDPMRVYATGISRDNAGYLLFSSDRGQSWELRSIPNTSFDRIPYIAAVHPHHPDKIFVRIDGRIFSDADGRYHADDAVLYSEDGGNTWTEIHHAEGKALGFALAPDAASLLIGYGYDGVFEVDEAALGAYASSTERFEFTHVLDGSITCLAWTQTGVYVCTPQSKAGRELAFAPRLALGAKGADLEPLLKLPELKGPLACCDAARSAVCKSAWPTACLVFQACGDASPPSDCTRDGGKADAAGAPSDAAAADVGPVSASTRGCDCQTGAARTRRDVQPWWPGCFVLALARSMKTRRIQQRRRARGDATRDQ
jgi:hypothetical protein